MSSILTAIFAEWAHAPASDREFQLEVFAAESWPLRWAVVDDAGAPKSLSGASAIWVLKRWAEGTELLRKIPAIDVDQTNNTGQLSLTVTPADSAGLASGRYYHELQITDSIGKTRKVAHGPVLLFPTGIRS